MDARKFAARMSDLLEDAGNARLEPRHTTQRNRFRTGTLGDPIMPVGDGADRFFICRHGFESGQRYSQPGPFPANHDEHLAFALNFGCDVDDLDFVANPQG